MTVIAGLVHEGKVVMAADSRNNVYDRPIIGAAQKLHRKPVGAAGEALLGVTGDGALMRVIRKHLQIDGEPILDKENPDEWADAIAEALTECALDAHLTDGEGRMDGTVMLGWGGRLWSLTHMQAIPHPEGVAVLGSGDDLALGALEAFLGAGCTDPVAMAVSAVRIACKHNDGCREPVRVEVLPPSS